MTLLVDATTAEHAVGISVVIDQFLGALPDHPEAVFVAHGPRTAVDARIDSSRIGLARTNAGRLLFQRFALPSYAARLRTGIEIDGLLLMDAYVPHVSLRGLVCTCYVHDVLPLTAGAFWPLVTRLVKRAGFAALRRTDVRLVTSTSHNAAQIHDSLGRRADVVCYGCGQLSDLRADALLERGPGPKSSTILYIGALDPRKNVTTLIDAFCDARPELPTDAELLIVGTPRDRGGREILRAVIDARGSRVRHLPMVSRERAMELIDGAGAVVLPSSHEGFGLSLLEALASGTPAVASDIPAIRAWAGESLNYARPSEAGELPRALIAALGQPDAVRASGQQFARRFRWGHFATELLRIAQRRLD